MKTAECKINKASLVIEACNQSAGMVARVEGLRGRMDESMRQVEGLFESLLGESFQT